MESGKCHGLVIQEEPLAGRLVWSLLPAGFDDLSDQIDSEKLSENAFVWVMPCRLTAILLDHLASLGSGCDSKVNAFDQQVKHEDARQRIWHVKSRDGRHLGLKEVQI